MRLFCLVWMGLPVLAEVGVAAVQVRRLARLVSLQELKQHSEAELEGMALLSKGRLSVQPVTRQQWDFVLGLEDRPPEEEA